MDLASHAIAAADVAAPATMAENFDRLATLGLISDPLASRVKKAVSIGASGCLLASQPSDPGADAPPCVPSVSC